jgi:hypothetical protein
MPSVLNCPPLAILADVRKLKKEGKLTEKHLGKVKDTTKSVISTQEKLFDKHFDGLVAEAKTLVKNLEKLLVERDGRLAGMEAQVIKMGKLQRDGVIAARKAAEASLASFSDGFDDIFKVLDLLKDEPASADIRACLAAMEKRREQFSKARKGLETRMAEMVQFDTQSSAMMKTLMVKSKGYNDDAATFDKKLAAMAAKIKVTLEQFRASCDRMLESKDDEEFMKHVQVSVKFVPALKKAVDTLAAMAIAHPSPATAKPDPDALRKSLYEAFVEMDQYGIQVTKKYIKARNGVPPAMQPYLNKMRLDGIIKSLG